jgi:hypothetical protein
LHEKPALTPKHWEQLLVHVPHPLVSAHPAADAEHWAEMPNQPTPKPMQGVVAFASALAPANAQMSPPHSPVCPWTPP